MQTKKIMNIQRKDAKAQRAQSLMQQQAWVATTSRTWRASAINNSPLRTLLLCAFALEVFLFLTGSAVSHQAANPSHREPLLP
jgi:hypothetical protein